jgi:hypothetical protein
MNGLVGKYTIRELKKMMRWFKKSSPVKLKIVTFYFAGGCKTFYVTDDIFESLKNIASNGPWDPAVTWICNSQDGSVAYIAWNKVNYVEFQ